MRNVITKPILIPKNYKGGNIPKFQEGTGDKGVALQSKKQEQPAPQPKQKLPAFYISFKRKAKVDGTGLWNKFKQWGANKANIQHAGFIYVKEDGTPVYKEYGVRTDGKSQWGKRVDLSGAPKYTGEDPELYMKKIYSYLQPVHEGQGANVTLIPDADPTRIESYINSIPDDDYRAYNMCGNDKTCATVAFNALIQGSNTPTTETGFRAFADKQGAELIPDGKNYARRLQNRGYRTFEVAPSSDINEHTTRLLGLHRARRQEEAVADFQNVKDKNRFVPLGFLKRYGHTCIYNGTRNYYPNHTLAKNETIVNEPEKHGWREISQSEVLPGDAIVLHDSNGKPVHFTIFDGLSPKDKEPYYYKDDATRVDNDKGKRPRMVQPGDTLLIYAPGTPGGGIMRHQAPLFRFEQQYNTGGDFSGPRRYFRATGHIPKKE